MPRVACLRPYIHTFSHIHFPTYIFPHTFSHIHFPTYIHFFLLFTYVHFPHTYIFYIHTFSHIHILHTYIFPHTFSHIHTFLLHTFPTYKCMYVTLGTYRRLYVANIYTTFFSKMYVCMRHRQKNMDVCTTLVETLNNQIVVRGYRWIVNNRELPIDW